MSHVSGTHPTQANPFDSLSLAPSGLEWGTFGWSAKREVLPLRRARGHDDKLRWWVSLKMHFPQRLKAGMQTNLIRRG